MKGRGKEISGLFFFCFEEEIGVHLLHLLDKSMISQ